MARHLMLDPTKRVSQEEFVHFVREREDRADRSHYELLNGRVVMNPPAGYPHGEIGSSVQILLGVFIRQRKLGKLLDSSQGFELPSGDTVEPDHSYVARERWLAAPTPKLGEFLKVVPDLVVEVLSLRTASQDRGEKKAIYERNGVREYWLIDPRARTLCVFLLDGARFDGGRTLSADQRWESKVLDGLDFPIAELFPADDF